jgi:hypothetical protein
MKYIARITYKDEATPVKILTADSLDHIKCIIGNESSNYGVVVDRYHDGHSDIVAIRKAGAENWVHPA